MSTTRSARRALPWLLCLHLLSSGCAGPRLAATTATTTFAGSATSWRRVRSDHFDVRTDLPEQDAIIATACLEFFRSILLSAAWPDVKLPAGRRLGAYIFANPLEYQALAGRGGDAYFSRDHSQDFIVLQGHPDSWERQRQPPPLGTTIIPMHELSHALLQRIQGPQPRWLTEGLAQFFSTIAVPEDMTTATLGMPNADSLQFYSTSPQVTVRELLDWGEADGQLREEEVGARYGMSWVLVHWMYNTHPSQFIELQQRIVRGQQPREAFLEVFADPGPERLTPILREYLQHGSYQERTVPVALKQPELKVDPLSEADVHALRALIASAHAFSRDGDHEGLRHGELDAALKLDPGNVAAAWQILPRLNLSAALTLARETTHRHPEDGMAWSLLGMILHMRDSPYEEVVEAYEQAMKLAPDSAHTAATLASHYVKHGRSREALPLIRRALELAPMDLIVLDSAARVAAAVGTCAEAVELQTRALALLPRNAVKEMGEGLRERLEGYRSGCGKPAVSH